MKNRIIFTKSNPHKEGAAIKRFAEKNKADLHKFFPEVIVYHPELTWDHYVIDMYYGHPIDHPSMASGYALGNDIINMN